jgi:hypothetical protein
MKSISVFLICAAAAFAADTKAPARKSTSTTDSSAAATAKPRPPVAPVTIPANATRIAENTYAATDAQGHAWVYQRTPFGIRKLDQKVYEDQVSPQSAPSAPVETRVTEKGDSVQFERSGPFGKQSWTHKKTELTDEERSLWEKQKQGSTPKAQ